MKIKDDRYIRQKALTWWNQDILQGANVLVAGVGTGGNEVCKNVALLGIGNVTIIDFERIESVNLSRCTLFREKDVGKYKVDVAAERMRELNPEIKITTIVGNIIYDFGSANYKDFDAVIIGVDSREARIWINRYCWLNSIPFINAGMEGMEFELQTIIPQKTACYECTLTSVDYKIMRQRYSCTGLLKSIDEGKIPMIIATASIVGGFMVQEILLILHGIEPAFAGKKLIVNGKTGEFDVVKVLKKDSCLGHWEIEDEEVVRLDFSNEITLRALKQKIKEELKIDDFEIEHDHSILYGAFCPACKRKKEILGIAEKVNENEIVCPSCNEVMNPDIDTTIKIGEKTLAEHGVPNNHILMINSIHGRKYLIPETSNKRKDNR